MRIRLPLLATVVATAVLAGSLGTGVASGAATKPVPSSSATVTLRFGSDGSTVLAHKGELVIVQLSGDHLRWSAATAVQSSPVLAPVSSGVSSTGSSRTVFRVVGYGTAEVDATGTPLCVSSSGCVPFVLLWHATVVVPVVDPPGPTSG